MQESPKHPAVSMQGYTAEWIKQFLEANNFYTSNEMFRILI